MAYSKTTWTGGVTALSAENMNHLETQYDEAVSVAASDVDSDITTHAALTTGVHGVGAGTVAKTADIATDSNLSAEAQDAISKRHTQGTDTTLGTMTANIAMGTKKITGLGDPSAAQDAATKAYVDSIIAGGIPSGVIVMWSGLAANIPSGWYLCDGNNSTPDLRGKFIKAATLNPGTTGGSATHTHSNHSSLTHSGCAVDSHPSLSHSGCAVASHGTLSHSGGAVANYSGNSGTAGGLTWTYTPGATSELTAQAHTHSINHGHSFTQPSSHGTLTHTVTQPNAHGSLSHTVTQAAAHTISAHSTASNEPPYYELAFIMKS